MDLRRFLLFSLLIVPSAIASLGCSPGRGAGRSGDPSPSSSSCPQGCASCDAQNQCRDCSDPGKNVCRGASVVFCNSDGSFGDKVKDCAVAAGERCANADCLAACDVAAATHSYIGCDYWPTTTLSSELNPYFDFAVAVANPG